MPGDYEIHRAAVAKLLFGKTYYPDMVPIYHDLYRRAKEVQRVAKVKVGKDSGRLASRIELSSRAAPPYWWFKIEGNTAYAYIHHQGTKPHIIEGHLEFPSGGRLVHTRIVHHPGTEPNPYLRTALPAFLKLRQSVATRPLF
jgi:hypothetical protein